MAYTMETPNLGNFDHNVAKPSGFAAAPALSYPALIFLHGSGQQGNGLADGLTRDAPTPITEADNGNLKRDSDGNDYDFVVFAPYKVTDWSGSGLGNAIKDIKNNAATYKIDITKIFVTGLSLGGIAISIALGHDTDSTHYEVFRGAYLLSGSNTNFENIESGQSRAQNLVDRWNDTALEVVKSAYGLNDPNSWVIGAANTSHLANQVDVDAIQTGIYQIEEAYRTFNYDNEASGPFVLDEIVTWDGGTGTGKLLTLDDNGNTGKMWVSLISGTAPQNDHTLVGGTSGATADIDGAPSTVVHEADAWGTMYSNFGVGGYASMYGEIEAISLAAPLFTSALVSNGVRNKIVMTYDGALDTGSVPATTDFAVSGGKSVTDVAISGSTVTLTVDSSYIYVDTITVSYTKGSNPLKADGAAGECINLSNEAVSNNIQDTTAPSSPTGFVFTNVAKYSMTFSWDASTDSESGIKDYKVWLDGVDQLNTTGLTHNFTNLNPNQSYTCQITAYDNAGNNAASSQAQTTLDDPVAQGFTGLLGSLL